MKRTKFILLIILSFLTFTQELFSQSDKEEILQIRNASNLAIKSYNTSEVLSYLTEDVLITTGGGSLLCGKAELEKYLSDFGGNSKMYWIRNAKEIIVNAKGNLAWETGNWNAYDPEKDEESLVSGNYSAMWTKESDVWKIKSQLFVTLEER